MDRRVLYALNNGICWIRFRDAKWKMYEPFKPETLVEEPTRKYEQKFCGKMTSSISFSNFYSWLTIDLLLLLDKIFLIIFSDFEWFKKSISQNDLTYSPKGQISPKNHFTTID